MARLRTMASQPDVADLRERSEAEIRAFDARAEKAGVAAEQARRARYVGRPASASTAAGQMSRHLKELQTFLDEAFA